MSASVQCSIQKYDHLTADRVMTANIKSLVFYVVMTPFPFYKSMVNFSGWSCSYKNGALWAKFQPGVLNPFVLICACLLYLVQFKRNSSCYAVLARDGNWKKKLPPYWIGKPDMLIMSALFQSKAEGCVFKLFGKQTVTENKWLYHLNEKQLLISCEFKTPSWKINRFLCLQVLVATF